MICPKCTILMDAMLTDAEPDCGEPSELPQLMPTETTIPVWLHTCSQCRMQKVEPLPQASE